MTRLVSNDTRKVLQITTETCDDAGICTTTCPRRNPINPMQWLNRHINHKKQFGTYQDRSSCQVLLPPYPRLLRNATVDCGGLQCVEIEPLQSLNRHINHKKQFGTYRDEILLPGTPSPHSPNCSKTRPSIMVILARRNRTFATVKQTDNHKKRFGTYWDPPARYTSPNCSATRPSIAGNRTFATVQQTY